MRVISAIKRSFVAILFLTLTLNIIVLPERFHSTQNTEQDDPINSITEFVMEVCLDYEDLIPGDERNEDEPISNNVKITSYFLTANILFVPRPANCGVAKNKVIFSDSYQSVFFDINTPPPELG